MESTELFIGFPNPATIRDNKEISNTILFNQNLASNSLQNKSQFLQNTFLFLLISNYYPLIIKYYH